MQILQRFCWLPPIQKQVHNFYRHYAKKPKPAMSNNRHMVQQELLHYVNPYARINIKSDIFVHLEPADVHVHTSGDVFIAQMLGDAALNCNAKLDVDVSDDDKVVNVVVKKLKPEANRFKCHLKLPVRAEPHIDAEQNVTVHGTQGEALEIKAMGNIIVKNVRATNVSLFSESGNIITQGTLLGRNTKIESNNGNLYLDKLQGDSLSCLTKAGNIVVDSCYVEKSKFETTTGKLELKNVHKVSEVQVHEAGELKMTGVHGNLKVNSNGGRMFLQLSELNGSSEIIAQNQETEAVINISEDIEKNTSIQVDASQVNLDNALEHVSQSLNGDKSKFQLSNANENQLVVKSSGTNGVRLGKQSWGEMMFGAISPTN
ncbi:hypothetical protein KR222_006030 [Zaprionus bogoriensis]|nr:hypothetical protein KR222_006030 [Zaprionus bogoriensis]